MRKSLIGGKMEIRSFLRNSLLGARVLLVGSPLALARELKEKRDIPVFDPDLRVRKGGNTHPS